MEAISKRPMLAADFEDWEQFWKYHSDKPYFWVSPKIDGIRATWDPELRRLVSRTRKPIPNQFIQTEIRELIHSYGIQDLPWDGELVTYAPPASEKCARNSIHGPATIMQAKDFNSIQSDVMSAGGRPHELTVFSVFDVAWTSQVQYIGRIFEMEHCLEAPSDANMPGVHIAQVEQVRVLRDDLEEHVARLIGLGLEGAIIRCGEGGPYKANRSTLKQGYLVKAKHWKDAEGKIIGFEELYKNDNKATTGVLGLTERSSHKANMLPQGTLGALVVETQFGELRVGTGFDMSLRQQIWDDQSNYLGKTISFRYMPVGMQSLPRAPSFKGFRHD